MATLHILHLFPTLRVFLILCITSLSFAPSIYGQVTYSDKEILQQAVRNHETKLNQLGTTETLSLPDKQWIDQMEFRTEFNRLDIEEQEYVFRMRFRNDKLRKLQNQLLQMKKSYLETESLANLKDGATDIYEGLIIWHFNQLEDTLARRKLELIKDKNVVETTLFNTDVNANFNDVLKIKERAKNAKLELFDLQWELANTLKELNIDDPKSKLKISNLIAIEAIQGVVESLDGMIKMHPDVLFYRDRISMIDQEYRIEENDKENLLRFAQLKYKADDNLALEREFSVGVAFTIPYKLVDRGSLAEIELDKIEENIDQQERIIELETDLNEEQLELNNLIQRYNYLENLIEEENLTLLREEYLKSQRVKPLPLINLELMIIDRETELLQVQKQIYLQYISTLQSIGALRFSTNTNFLNQALQPID